MRNDLVTFTETARILGMDRDTLMYHVKQGHAKLFPSDKQGRHRYFFLRSDVEDMTRRWRVPIEANLVTRQEACAILMVSNEAFRMLERQRGINPAFPAPEDRGTRTTLYYRRSDLEALRPLRRSTPSMKMVRRHSVADRAYLAGLIDGEGTIIISQGRGKHYALKVSIANTFRPVIDWVDEEFGPGCIVTRTLLKPHWRQPWAWNACSVLAFHTLQAAFPYLKIKREQAAIGMKFQERMSKRQKFDRLSPDEVSWREEQKQHISSLNQR